MGIEVAVSVTPQLSQVAELLEWVDGGVPNAMVIIQSDDGAGEAIVDTSTTDDAGAASFATLPLGKYRVRVTRDLSQEELSRASARLGDVYALEGTAAAVVDQSGGGRIVVTARGVTRGSLVLMELFPTSVPLPDGGNWTFGNYVKVYNNSDTAVALAGKLFFQGFVVNLDVPRFPCSLYSGLVADPAGIWAGFIYRFPEDANPLPPGRSILLARDALDHRQFGMSSGLHDLSAAQFEFRGSSDVDNPAAKDMLSVGPRVYPLEGGWRAFEPRSAVGLANPLSIDTLPSHLSPGTDASYARIPAGAILDIVQWGVIYEWDYPLCPSSVFADLDAAEARIIFGWDTLSMHRRVRLVLPDGRPVLQRSKNSAADWIAAPGTPSSVP